MFKPRPKQQEVLDYKNGRMGVSAVPGSGKTRTLSYLAAQLVATAPLTDDQEVLVVTLVNSAADHFNRQVGEFVREYGLLPGFGYRVRTLHGLSNDIVRERPALAGLDEGFLIVDEREADEILQDAADSWARMNPQILDEYIAPEYQDSARIRNKDWPQSAIDIARSFIRHAKDFQLSPEQIRQKLDRSKDRLPLVEMGWNIYLNYQRGLNYRGAVDFQDLIRLALKVLELDKDYLKRLQERWPYILEDEAQDSSLAQEKMLRLLVGKKGNWVRMGDPNQAIYETFTAAAPRYLREFLQEKGVQRRELPNSGRSALSIIRLANSLIEWTQRHPVEDIRAQQPLQPPFIEPAPPDDPQPNPPDEKQVFLWAESLTPAAELKTVISSIKRWLPQHPDQTLAVLVPRNTRGFEVANLLKQSKIEYVELLRSTSSTREVAASIADLLNSLAKPTDPAALADLYRVWQRDLLNDPEAEKSIEEVSDLIKHCRNPEDFIWPRLTDWLETFQEQAELHIHLDEFRLLVRRWQEAAVLPVDQLVLTAAQDLFRNPAELATAYSIALYLRHFSETHPRTTMLHCTDELMRVARNERKFLGISDQDLGFDPDQHKGKVTIATLHTAKGLEWDRVYLMSVNNYDFPSAQIYDSYISEKWFIRDHLNLEAESLAQLESLQEKQKSYIEGLASREARVEYSSERLRLLYVGITRARRELIMTWNTGRKGDMQEAMPMLALRTFWEGTRQ